jgi:hypothetical protein
MMDSSFYLAITFLSSHHKHLLLIISVSSTNSSSSSEVTMDTDPNPALSMEMKDAQSPSPLTLFLQCKDETKKYVLPKGSTGLTLERLHLAFIEKFEVDLPKIYIKDPASGVQYELEDPTDVEDRSLLILNEVKQHIESKFY